ncbi:MAG: hypothetical protein GXY32_06105 [Ruminococcaceae bacterium]|nr:hypothetical protein [Oscillospiraceae bacterium]
MDVTGKRGVIYFGGAFWTEYWQASPPEELPLNGGYIYMNCQLDGSVVGTDQQIAIQLSPTKSVSLKVKENQPTANKLTKTAGAYNPDTGRFSWTIEYTPGNEDATVATWLHDVYNTAAHEFVAGSMVINGGALAANTALAPTVAREAPAPGQATLKVDLGTAGTLEKLTKYTITYQTALSDAALTPAVSGSALRGSGTTTANNQAYIRESQTAADNKAASAQVSLSAAADKKQWMVKTGTQDPDNGRLVNWTVTIKTLDRKLTGLRLRLPAR